MEKTNLEFVQERAWRYTCLWGKVDRWPRICFEGGAPAKFGAVCGYISALADCGKEELAAVLADAFCSRFDYLNQYGGDTEIQPSDAEKPLSFPRYKIVLGDDGTWGGFSVLAYKAVPHADVMEKAEGLQASALESMVSDKDPDDYWQECLKKAKEQLRIKQELEEHRCYRPSWDKEGKCMFSYQWVHYGFSWNGGLLVCGAKDIHKMPPEEVRQYGVWSIHT